MVNFFAQIQRSRLKFPISKAALITLMSAGGLLTGLVPALEPHSLEFRFDSYAYAQGGDSQIARYARAAFEIEQLRQRNYAAAKRIMGGNVPENVCQQANIPAQVRDICNRFLSDSADILDKYRLSGPEFNDITRRKSSDPSLQQQIQGELLRIQKGR